jgi:plastocyanin
MPSRRRVLQIGGGLLASLAWQRLPFAGEPVEIRMRGKADGSHVWFDPIGLHVKPGQTIRWINLDSGNSHTVRRAMIVKERTPYWNSKGP